MVVVFGEAEPFSRLYLSSTWDQGVPDSHREYVADLLQHLASLPIDELERFMQSARDFSVGPLRFSVDGTCDEQGLARLLHDTFGESGHTRFSIATS